MTIQEAADRLGLGKKRVYQLVKKTFPDKRKVFGLFTFTEDEVEEMGKHSRSWALEHCSSSEMACGRMVVDTRGGGEG